MNLLKKLISILFIFIIGFFLFQGVRNFTIWRWSKSGNKPHIEMKFENSMFLGGSGINFYKDGTYDFSFGSCLTSGKDTGYYKITNDTIRFKSVNLKLELLDKLNLFKIKNHHNQITPLNNEKYLIKNDSIFEINKMNLLNFRMKIKKSQN